MRVHLSPHKLIPQRSFITNLVLHQPTKKEHRFQIHLMFYKMHQNNVKSPVHLSHFFQHKYYDDTQEYYSQTVIIEILKNKNKNLYDNEMNLYSTMCILEQIYFMNENLQLGGSRHSFSPPSSYEYATVHLQSSKIILKLLIF